MLSTLTDISIPATFFVVTSLVGDRPVKVWVDGHQVGQAAGTEARPGFHRAVGGFAACEDPALLQRICDDAAARHHRVFFQRWMHRLPLPLGPADRQAGYWWECSMAQVEVSRTIVFSAPRYARAFFGALVTGNLDLGRPGTLEIIFDRQVRHGPQIAHPSVTADGRRRHDPGLSKAGHHPGLLAADAWPPGRSPIGGFPSEAAHPARTGSRPRPPGQSERRAWP